jgi:D-alanine transaminase
MDSYAYYNGKFGKRSDIQIPLSDRSIFFGDAIYDAALVVNGKIVWEKEHINRFFESARALFIPVGVTKEELKQTLRDTVKKSNFENAFLYFQLSRTIAKR